MPKPIVTFGHPIRKSHFQFDAAYLPLNHGTYGAFPIEVRDRQREIQDLTEARPDTFIRYQLPKLIEESRAAVAPFLGVSTDEIVFVPNVTTAINVVLKNLIYKQGDVLLYFSTVYRAVWNTLKHVCETTPLDSVCVDLEYPIEDSEAILDFKKVIEYVKKGGRQVRIALFDTVSAFPGVRVPWEDLVDACKKDGILSLVDGAHGIGHLDLTKVGEVGPDFFTSSCHKWLYVPRGCAILHVPARKQHLIHTAVPTSHVRVPMQPATEATGQSENKEKNYFVKTFTHAATIDSTPYACVHDAIKFRQQICGGEEGIRKYCRRIVILGADHVAHMLGTEVMDNKSHTLTKCCFANVRLPLIFVSRSLPPSKKLEDQSIFVDEASVVGQWITDRTISDSNTMISAKFHAGALWVRFSGQIYLDMADFDCAGTMLKRLCERVRNGEGRS